MNLHSHKCCWEYKRYWDTGQETVLWIYVYLEDAIINVWQNSMQTYRVVNVLGNTVLISEVKPVLD